MTAPTGKAFKEFPPPLDYTAALDPIVGKSAGNKIVMGNFLTPGTVVSPVAAYTVSLTDLVRAMAGKTGALPGDGCYFAKLRFQKICEVDPLVCLKCQETMRIISFIEDPQVSGISSIIWDFGW
jgi:hypothetical protein